MGSPQAVVAQRPEVRKAFLLRLRVRGNLFDLVFCDQKTNKIKKAIISANNAIASVRAKPKMA